MFHTNAFRRLAHTIASASDVDASARHSRSGKPTRRDFVKAAAATTAAWSFARPDPSFAQSNATVAIVGAGLAGLACADRLAARGIAATVYDAAPRAGGRCFSLRGRFPGQVVERGGELIDNLHKTMIGYAKRYRLTLEDYEKQPGEVAYFFDGARWPEEAVVDEYRRFVAAMRRDLRRLSNGPNADSFNASDAALDLLSLAEYLVTRQAGPLVAKAIESAYKAEYGLDIDEQSALNLLMFIHADHRSRF